MSWLARSFVVKVPRRAWCEMTAEAIASSRAMIDFHGLVLRLTRSTCVDRSICLPFCTGLLLARPFVRLTLSGGGPALPITPETQERWGAVAPQSSCEMATTIFRGLLDGKRSLSEMQLDTPEAEALQAGRAAYWRQ